MGSKIRERLRRITTITTSLSFCTTSFRSISVDHGAGGVTKGKEVKIKWMSIKAEMVEETRKFNLMYKF